MAGQTLTTTILINAKAGNGFEEVGNTLMELSGLVNGISTGAQQTLKDSANVYRNYQASMAQARIALGTVYGQDTDELEKVMIGLDEAAQEWAATTIFHTNDVGNAIADAAHAGWTYEQIIADMPAVMRLAQAGGMELSETVSYITATMEAAGLQTDELEGFIDSWAFAANSSRGTIRDFGDTMTRMQSMMRFTDSTEELMTLIAVTADMGSTGSEAGTMIRNAILRLAAPTSTAQDLMDSLGASAEEMSEAMETEGVGIEAAGEQLQQYGFSAYDTQGRLKPVLQQFSELYDIMQNMAGEGEDISKNANTVPILETIFGKRGIIEGINLMQKASENYGGLYQQLINGDQEGYATWAQETMWETLDNKIEAFQSKVEKLQSVVGEEFAGDLESIMAALGGFIDGLSNMDDAQMAVFVSGLETLAALGPGLMITGGALSVIGKVKKVLALSEMGPVILGVTATATALIMLENALKKLDEIDYENQFGNLNLDQNTMRDYANDIAGSFQAAYENINTADESLTKFTEDFSQKSAQLKKDLFEGFITGKFFSDEDKENYVGQAEEVADAVTGALNSEYEKSKASVAKTYEGDEDNPLFAEIMSALDTGYTEAIGKAEDYSTQLRNAIFSAFADNTIVDSEIDKIQGILDEMNAQLSDTQGRLAYRQADEVFRKAQTLGIENVNEIAEEFAAAREATLAPIYQAQADVRYDAMKGGASAAALADIKAKQESELAQAAAAFNVPIIRDYMAAMSGSDLTGAWDAVSSYASGGRTSSDLAALQDVIAGRDLSNLSKFVDNLVELAGGAETLSKSVGYLDKAGMADEADAYRQLLAMQEVLMSPTDSMGYMTTAPQMAKSDFEALNDIATQYLTTVGDIKDVAMSGDWSGFENIYDDLMNISNVEPPDLASWISEAMGGGPVGEVPVKGVVAEIEMEDTDLTQAADVDVPVGADVSDAQGDIESLDGQELTENVDGDVSGLSSAIDSQDGRTITTHVNGDTSGLRNAIAALSHQTVYVNVAQRRLFAEGGRATSASIFGEAGPEWAIPEEHSQRTAELLDAARQASGFTWPDLLGRLGGLNANTENSPATLVYSPTINANDASGVEAVLREDKFRLERWFAERQMRERMEVYA